MDDEKLHRLKSILRQVSREKLPPTAISFIPKTHKLQLFDQSFEVWGTRSRKISLRLVGFKTITVGKIDEMTPVSLHEAIDIAARELICSRIMTS